MSKFIILLVVLLNWGEELLGTTLRGARVRSGQFPWLIQFQTIAPCGGILISPDWVLTAAQCVQYKRNSITLYAASLNGTGSGQIVGVKATYIFPQYQAYSMTQDHEHNIALLKLVQPFDMCDDKVQLLDVAPVRLDYAYKTCLIFGWQSYVASSTKVLAKPIQYSHVILNSWKVCMYMLKGNTSYNNVFCTMVETEDGMRACAGNPGSPVVCEDKNQRMTLLGIASWSNFSLDCGGIPTYLAVSVFRAWMYDLIFNDKTSEEWNNGSKSKKGACEQNPYSRSIISRINRWNHSDVKAEFKQRGDRPNINKQTVNKAWRPLQSELLKQQFREQAIGLSKVPDIRSRLDNSPDTDDYSQMSSRYQIPFDITRDRDDGLKQYHEVGQNREESFRRDGIIGKGKPIYLGQPNINEELFKDKNKAMKIDFEDKLDRELDDTDFMIPLYEDYLIGQSSSPYFHSRKYFTILTSFVNCILMNFL